jgi:hypothetical protein
MLFQQKMWRAAPDSPDVGAPLYLKKREQKLPHCKLQSPSQRMELSKQQQGP